MTRIHFRLIEIRFVLQQWLRNCSETAFAPPLDQVPLILAPFQYHPIFSFHVKIFSLSQMVFLNLSGVPIEFPFQPYDVQEKFMEKVIECLQKVKQFSPVDVLTSVNILILRESMVYWNHPQEREKLCVCSVLV